MSEDHDLVEKITALHEEVARLRLAVASDAVVDQAIGVVITLGTLRPEEGWEVLQAVARQTGTKLLDVADHLVRWAHSGWLPDTLEQALDAALTRDAR
ncbi:ANTAR domain-containing protein [Streptomyces sp. Ru71]|uniref:ANTAR domain-containing protein n=1 Tax=Streptomyces sp. Ru71 TaxID=2080746 RepID=UPI000CDDC3DA|nr:ANTAR domain-containing protein [Streptomyces sp. Ru71]POX45468.1 ANTAR domain-containing protein [Streptomyces sp. Ru71]